MGPSKGKARKKSKKSISKKQSINASTNDEEDFRPTLINTIEKTGEWVKIKFKLLNWSYMDYTSSVICVQTSTIKKIKRELETRHESPMCSWKFYLDKVTAENELSSDDSMTLKECGVHGGSNIEEVPEVTLYYDFKVPESNNAVLLA